MTITKYYDIDTVFPSGVNYNGLNRSIENSSFGTKLLSVFKKQNTLIMSFKTLTGSEETELSSIISTHDPNVFEEIANSKSVPVIDGVVSDTNYNLVSTFVFAGSFSIKKVLCSAYMDSANNTNYSIRIYDSTNFNVLEEKIFTNTVEDVVELSSLTNIPQSLSKIEIQAKINGSNNAYISAIDVLYNKKPKT